eukprot:gene501-8015_t
MINHHRELCKSQRFFEAREYRQKHKIEVDWSHVSHLISKESFHECLYYIKGFYDLQNVIDNEENVVELQKAQVMLENFLYFEDKENLENTLETNIRKILLPKVSFVSKKYQNLDAKIKSASKSAFSQVLLKKQPLGVQNGVPLKKRFSQKENSTESFFKKPEPSQKKQKKESENLRDLIFEVLETLKEPASWDALKVLIPGDKNQIFQELNEMVAEDIIELNQMNETKKGYQKIRLYEISPQQIFHNVDV